MRMRANVARPGPTDAVERAAKKAEQANNPEHSSAKTTAPKHLRA